jgi:hypothetical protein
MTLTRTYLHARSGGSRRGNDDKPRRYLFVLDTLAKMHRYSNRLLIVSRALLLGACGQLTWAHPAGAASFEQDAYERSQTGVHVSTNTPDVMTALNVECMEARGWELH